MGPNSSNRIGAHDVSGASKAKARIVAALRGMEFYAPGKLAPPEGGGVYAWWVRCERLGDARPKIPIVPHPTVAGWSLLYVGIVPRKGELETRRSFKSRVGKDHRSGSIGNSTFRQSLASLLISHLALRPKLGFDRPRFADERLLTQWIEDHCAVTFASCSQPWISEKAVIGEMRPPLNITSGIHEFRHAVKSARKALRQACGLPSSTATSDRS